MSADGKITGLDAAKTYQYKLKDASAWTNLTAGATEITSLAAGDYLIRYAGVNRTRTFPSVAATATVGYTAEPRSQLKVNSIDMGTVTIGNSDLEYFSILDDGCEKAATISKVELTGNDKGYFSLAAPETPVYEVPLGGSSDNWRLTLSANAPAGSHGCTVVVTYNNGKTATAAVTAKVEKKTVDIYATPPLSADYEKELVYNNSGQIEPVYAIQSEDPANAALNGKAVTAEGIDVTPYYGKELWCCFAAWAACGCLPGRRTPRDN